MVVLRRSPDRDCLRRRGRRRRRRALAEATERAMHFCNQARELIDADSILRDVATDDPRNQAEINRLRGTFFNHIFYPNVRTVGDLCSRERLVLQFIQRKLATACRREA
jgi:hypothetical protein